VAAAFANGHKRILRWLTSPSCPAKVHVAPEELAAMQGMQGCGGRRR
jgi:hypothetical protein